MGTRPAVAARLLAPPPLFPFFILTFQFPEGGSMGARTGQQYLAGLRAAGAEVWLEGERIADVTSHRATRNAARSIAALYDMQHDPALRASMTFPSPTTGEPVGMTYI